MRVIQELARAVDDKQEKTEDINELKILKNKLPMYDVTTASSIRRKIENKILKIQQQNAMDRIKNDIPENILQIITDLTNGTIDIEKAKSIIEQESSKRFQAKSKTDFSLTQEQEKKRILMQIKTAIIEQADKYTISNPESMVLQIKELCDENLKYAVNVVVGNLINKKDFETAKKICDKYLVKNDADKSYNRTLKNKIRNAELGDIVLRMLNMDTSIEEETKCFEILEKGIEKSNINLAAISLGKNKDGSKDITLAQIWGEEIIEQR